MSLAVRRRARRLQPLGPLRIREVSPVLARWECTIPTEATVRRRLYWVWGMLFFNTLTFLPAPTLFPIPSLLGKGLAQASLFGALAITLTINRRLVVRANVFLILFSLLALLSLLMSLHGQGIGSMYRAVRLTLFVLNLWLLTPWWGRRDLLFARLERRALLIILATVVVGAMLGPGKAFAQGGGGRLGGAIWPIPPTQVAHYAAVFTGLTAIMWFSGLMKARSAAISGVIGIALLVLTHTRTALVAMLVAVLVAGGSLFLSRRRVRKAFLAVLVVAGLIVLTFAPVVDHWFVRGESAQELSSLTGRADVWSSLVQSPRSEVNTLFGSGMSNDSFGGLSIDSSWLSVYLDQGLVGDAIIGLTLLALLAMALLSPRGPARAIALFLIVYAAIASYTETGLGNASPYLIDLMVTASLLTPGLANRSSVEEPLLIA